MQLPEPLERAWLLAVRYTACTLTISEEGIALGKTLLAPFREGRLAVDPERICTALSVTYSASIR